MTITTELLARKVQAPSGTSSKEIDAIEAASLVRPGATLMVGGFGLVGKPLALVEALLDNPQATELTVISNNLGEPGRGLGRLLLEGRIRKAIGSFFTSNPDVVAAHTRGELEVELTPQGTLAEAIRAGGAGIPAFYTRIGVGRSCPRGVRFASSMAWPTCCGQRCTLT